MLRAPAAWGKLVGNDPSNCDLFRQIITALLGWTCSKCHNMGPTDIHHIKHDGGAWRKKFGGYTPTYYIDILWGVLQGYKEVILLCRKCHEKHHKKNGYKEIL